MIASEKPPSNAPVGILVVDDHPNTASMLARALTQLGDSVKVTSATSGADALAKVKNSSVDIVITDMIMPEMTGLELIEKLQNHPGGRPSYSYLVTAYDVPGLKVTAQRLKVNEVIVKPVRPERIFQIALQAIEEMHQATKSPKPLKTSRKNFKILVADDQPDNITLLTRYLGNEGYEQVTAVDGIDTLEKIHTEIPDLILLDVNMPHKDGFTVLEEVRADPKTEHIPVIILTAARSDSSDVQSGLNLGADDYVTKPFDRRELMARIRTKLRVKEAEDVMRRRNSELSLLPEIGKELSARGDVQDLANILLTRTVETLGAEHGQLTIFDAFGSSFTNYQYKDLSIKFDLSQKLIDHIRESHQGLVINHADDDPFWSPGEDNKTKSAVIVPLFGRMELLGMLLLTHNEPQFFSVDHLLLLQAIASQASIAIENMKLQFNIAMDHMVLDAVMMNSSEAIFIFDNEGRVKQVNPAANKLFTNGGLKIGEKFNEDKYDSFVSTLEKAKSSQSQFSGEVAWPGKRKFIAHVTSMDGGGQVALLHETV